MELYKTLMVKNKVQVCSNLLKLMEADLVTISSSTARSCFLLDAGDRSRSAVLLFLTIAITWCTSFHQYLKYCIVAPRRIVVASRRNFSQLLQRAIVSTSFSM